MSKLPRYYDAWRLSGPDDDRPEIGTEDGQPCGRFAEPDEDAPRGYRPKQCPGYLVDDGDGGICDTCGETA